MLRSASKLIMVVDDKKVVRDVLCIFFEKKGYRTLAFSDGQSAITSAGKEKPDVVLMDIKMPGLDGITACQRLRQMWHSSPYTGIMMITGHDSRRNMDKAFSSGAIDVIKKPFDLEDIDSRIDTWFQVRKIDSGTVRSLVYLAKVSWRLNKEMGRQDQETYRRHIVEKALKQYLDNSPGIA